MVPILVLPDSLASPEEALTAFLVEKVRSREESSRSPLLVRGEDSVELHSCRQTQTRSLSEYLSSARVITSFNRAQAIVWPHWRVWRDGRFQEQGGVNV